MGGPATGSSNANLALGLAVAALLLLVVFAVAGVDGPLWLIVGVLGLGAAIVGWRAGGGRPQGLTLAATIAGALIALTVIVWGIVGG